MNLTHISGIQVISFWHLFPSFKWNGSLSRGSRPVSREPDTGTAEDQTGDTTQEMSSGGGSLKHSAGFAHAHCVYGI